LLVNKLRIKDNCDSYHKRINELEVATNLARSVLATSDEHEITKKFDDLLKNYVQEKNQ